MPHPNDSFVLLLQVQIGTPSKYFQLHKVKILKSSNYLKTILFHINISQCLSKCHLQNTVLERHSDIFQLPFSSPNLHLLWGQILAY